jgi:hypothetical protein
MIVAVGEARERGTTELSILHAARECGTSCAFFGMISSDEEGHAVLQDLVSKDILFDPSLCGSSYRQSEADDHLEGGLLLEAFRVNTDIRVVYVKGRNDALSAVLEHYSPRPIVVSEPRDGCLFDGADILFLENGHPASKPVFCVTDSRLAFLFPDGRRIETVGRHHSLAESEGLFLAFLHDAGCFGSDGAAPRLRLDEKAIRKALEAAC